MLLLVHLRLALVLLILQLVLLWVHARCVCALVHRSEVPHACTWAHLVASILLVTKLLLLLVLPLRGFLVLAENFLLTDLRAADVVASLH